MSILLRLTLGARILALTTTPSRSHHIWNQALLRALATRGHHVTSIGPDLELNPVPNLTHIFIEGAYESIRLNFDYEIRRKHDALKSLHTQFKWGISTCAHGLASQGAQELMRSNDTFDLIIVEVVFTECFLGFVDKFKYPPVLAVTAFGTPPWASYLSGSPEPPSFIPHFTLQYSDRMNFWQRLVNLIMHVFTACYRSLVYQPRMDDIARTHFGESLPAVSKIEKNIDLVLVNSHFSWDHPRPMTSAMIPVGGLHLQPPRRLPDDLQAYLNEAEDGLIFFSLGSNLKSSKLQKEKIKALLGAFQVLPQRILWKWESDILLDQPENVKISKWLPQNDILGHPNVRLFITHSGLLSTQEALYHGVPMVGIPFFADQYHNIHNAVTHGVGVKLDFNTLSTESVLAAVHAVLNNASYKENMQRLSKIFRDQTETPLQRAVFWTEYVLRHTGARHLRPSAATGGCYLNLLQSADILCACAAFLGSLAVLFMLIVVVLRVSIRQRKHS